MGEATAHIAAGLPRTSTFCAAKCMRPVWVRCSNASASRGLRNIRICAHDAVDVIDHMLPVQCLDGVHIFFPDPWHKARHNKRRLVQPPLVAKLAARLRPGGYIHCATDWQPYAEQMLDVLGKEPSLRNTASTTHPELLGLCPEATLPATHQI
jgi:tRNA (guanine-N7-)-methyltransferase